MEDRVVKKKERGFNAQWIRRDGKMSLVLWNDNKPVYLMSSRQSKYPVTFCTRWSKVHKRRIHVRCPSLVKSYNSEMGGVDLIDRFVALYRISTRTYKWTFRAIMHFLDLSVCQSWIMYRENTTAEGGKPVDLLTFKLTLAEKMLEADSESSEESSDEQHEQGVIPSQGRQPLPPSPMRQRRADHMPEYVVSTNPKRCRMQGCNRKSRVQCTQCRMILCMNPKNNCFLRFHRAE
ncbi:hypothetical protein WDU94_001879 [Cyamophila willieti]